MTIQTILYFISILLTFALTGWLAWYAWRHRQLPGSSAYARLALSECLWALAEILSVLSPSAAWALFWFQVRYLFGTLIGVFWFVFALEYNDHQDWLSKRLLAGLFIIPFITQALLWSNSLHGLWVQHEAAFIQKGPFWIADITARIPGLGYLTHSFYTLLLTLAGIALMLLTAWKMRREFIAQALMLAGAGLTAFFFVINSLFNLLPKMEFNPFTPGLGLSVLLIALAVFRFQFLKRVPAQESAARLTNLAPQEKRSLAIFIFSFILFASGLAAASYLTYQNYEKQFRAQVENQISAIAALKAEQLQNWRAERLADAHLFYQNKNFSGRVQAYLENPQASEAQAGLLAYLEKVALFPEYDRVFLLDAQGVERISIPATPDPDAVPAALVEHAAASLASDEVLFLDFHRHAEKSPIHLSLLVPIFDSQDHRPLGVLVLRINPQVYLDPFIQRWPVPSASAETLLVRREGEQVVYLNQLRFRQDTALSLRFPLADTDLPAVRAALGETGSFEGVDYRGQTVIANLRAVSDSPWFLVSKMNTAEVFAPLRERIWQTLLFFGVLVLAAGAGLVLAWRQQQVRFYRAQVETLNILRVSEEKFRLAFDTSPDSVAITRLRDGLFVSVNQGFEQISGYTREEVLGKTSAEVNIWKDPDDRRKVVEGLRANGEVRNYEAPFLTRTGEIYGLMSATIIQLNGEPHILNITRDITERKQAEEKLLASEIRYRRLFEAARDGILILDAETGVVVDANPFLAEMLSFPREEICGKTLWKLGFFNDILANKANFLELQQKEYIRYEDLPLEMADGRKFYVEFVSNVYQVGDHKVIQCNIRDITERKLAEDALKESERAKTDLLEKLNDAQRLARIGGWEWDLPTNQVWWSDETYRIFGVTPQDFVPSFEANGKFIHPDDLDKYGQAFEHSLQTGAALALDLRLVSGDGALKHCHAMGEIVYNEAGQALRFTGTLMDITERKQAEAALRQSEERMRAVLDATPFPIALVDIQDNQIEFWSQSALALFGQTAPTAAEWYQLAYPDPDYREEVIERWKPALEKARESAQAVNTGEYRIACRDGSVRICELYTAFVADKLVVTFNDITGRKQAEEKLVNSETHYRCLFEAARDGILILDAESGVVTDVNAFMLELLGFSHEVFLGKKLWDLGFFKDIAANQENYRELLRKDYIRYEDLPLETAQGRTINVEFVSNIYQVDHHKVVQCNIRDITERLQTEDALRESEDKFKHVFEYSTVGKSITQFNGGMQVNQALCDLLGYSMQEMQAKKWQEITHPDDIELTQREIDSLLSGEKESVRFVKRFLHKNGAIVWVDLSSSIRRDKQRQPLYLMSSVIDITERKRAEEILQSYSSRLEAQVMERTRELRNAQEQLVRQERLATLGQLAGSIGHELRNPLGVISNAVYYLKMSQPEASDKVREYLEIIEKETRTSDKIVTDLLDFTRIKSVDRESASVSELVQQTLERFPAPPSVQVTLEIPADLPQIYADPQQVVQVLGNLVINACQAMPSGGNLYVSAAVQGAMLMIAVRDTGQGIPPENMDKLFQPLFTTKTKGIGLGLAVSRKLAGANGGRIEVESVVGQGSTFTVYLPVFKP